MAKLHDLVVRKGGDAVVFYDGATETRLTYEQLHQGAEKVAAALSRLISDCDQCRSRQRIVGIYMKMSTLVPACILGILKASCCFVYLSPNESAAYLNRIVDRADVQYLIADFSFMALNGPRFAAAKTITTLFNQLQLIQLKERTSNEQSVENGCNDSGTWSLPLLAYIMFTSGTTGESKMVRVPHSCIVPNILHLWNEYKILGSDVIFLSSPLTFDPSIVDIFLALSSGATLLIVVDEIKMQPAKLADALFNRFRVSVLQTTPTLLLRFPAVVLKRILCPSRTESYGALRVLALGGEPFPCTAFAPYACYDDSFSFSRRLRLYNLYGPTEVSCWSMFHRVKGDEIRKCAVPIGRPMLGTQVRLVGRGGDLSDKIGTIGELHIGGVSRYCFVDEGSGGNNKGGRPSWLRPTGDLAVRKTDERGAAQYYLIGRTDDQVKRMGKRLNLLQISQIIETNVKVRNCAVVPDVNGVLRAFIELHAKRRLVGEPASIDKSVIVELRTTLQNLLPSHCQPDAFHLIKSMPMTKHGKVDKEALLRQAEKAPKETPLPKFSKETVESSLKTLLRNFIRNDQARLGSDTTFRELGIDSLNALGIASALERWIGKDLPNAMEIIASGTVSTLVNYLNSLTTAQPASPIRPSRKSTTVVSSWRPPKRAKVETEAVGIRIVEKCGRMRWTQKAGEDLSSGKLSANVLRGRVKLKWKWDSGKCIDASPVLVEDLTSDRSQVFIGSHSGKFACLDSKTGAVEWLNQLDGRIEASATVTGCGRYLVVGCYDGGVYFLERQTGDQWWKFQTEEAVKCTACVGELMNVYIGSHDHRLYKLAYQEKRCLWSVDLGSAVLSSPALGADGGRVFVATLQGVVYCLEAEHGAELWHRRLSKPVFSSLVVPNDRSVVALCVDGAISWIAATDGSLIGQFHANAPIFSTPSLIPMRLFDYGDAAASCLVFGCENGRAYCIRESDAELLWTKDFGCAISSSPFAFGASVMGKKRMLVCVVTKSGVLHLLRFDNGESYQYNLANEVFSSPVVFDGRVYIGCRDDALYCLEME